MPALPSQTELLELLRRFSYRQGDFRLASGRRSTHYVDARRTTMSARGLHLIGHLGLQAIRKAGWTPELVGGLTLGADPVAYALAVASHSEPPVIDGFTVRKAPKDHGTGSQIEGPFREGARVVVVEDVITTGGSARNAIRAISEAGGSVEGILAVVDREEGGRQALEEGGYPVIALASLAEIAAAGHPGAGNR